MLGAHAIDKTAAATTVTLVNAASFIPFTFVTTSTTVAVTPVICTLPKGTAQGLRTDAGV